MTVADNFISFIIIIILKVLWYLHY